MATASEIYLRHATHYSKAAERDKSLFDSDVLDMSVTSLGFWQVAVEEWPNIANGWRWACDRMRGDAAAGRLCVQYLRSLSNIVLMDALSLQLVPLAEASAVAAHLLEDREAEIAAITMRAIAYHSAADYLQAEQSYRYAIYICEEALGATHHSIGPLLSRLAGLCVSQERYEEAEALWKRAVKVYEEAGGTEDVRLVTAPDHPALGDAPLSSLAELYSIQNRYAEAVLLYERAIRICERAFGGSDHPAGSLFNLGYAAVLNDLGFLYYIQRRTIEAEFLFSRALSMCWRIALENPMFAGMLNKSLLEAQDAGTTGNMRYERALLALWRRALGPAPPVELTSAGLDISPPPITSWRGRLWRWLRKSHTIQRLERSIEAGKLAYVQTVQLERLRAGRDALHPPRVQLDKLFEDHIEWLRRQRDR